MQSKRVVRKTYENAVDFPSISTIYKNVMNSLGTARGTNTFTSASQPQQRSLISLRTKTLWSQTRTEDAECWVTIVRLKQGGDARRCSLKARERVAGETGVVRH